MAPSFSRWSELAPSATRTERTGIQLCSSDKRNLLAFITIAMRWKYTGCHVFLFVLGFFFIKKNTCFKAQLEPCMETGDVKIELLISSTSVCLFQHIRPLADPERTKLPRKPLIINKNKK